MMDIALGVQIVEGYDNPAAFAKVVGAAAMSEWADLGLFDEGVEGWGEAFEQVMARTIAAGCHVHFELNGLDIADALAGDPEQRNMSTSLSAGKNRLAVQFGNKGYYGEVELDVERSSPTGAIEVEFDPVAASQWQTGARFGIDYVLEHSSPRTLFPNGGRIHVSRIQGHLVDTNNAVIAYVTAMALIEALAVKPREMPALDAEKGLLIFPK
ncbi:MAG: hypothetical protein ACREHD_16815 [Pirellulales bacterium]